MAVRFPDTPQSVDPVEIDINNSFDRSGDFNSTGHLFVSGKKGENPGELSWPNGVAIDEISNSIYVAEVSPPRVSIFSKSGEFLKSFIHLRLALPCGIAIHRNNVYVSDIGVHGVFHFKIDSDIRLDASLFGRGSDDGKFYYPHQLTVFNSGEVFVADCYNHRIQILDESLHFQRSIKHDSMHYPLDVKLTNDEVFVLVDSSPCVIVFSHAGEKLRSLITCGEEMQVNKPEFFCLDGQQNLIIADYGDSFVKIFSPDADHIHSIEVGVECPAGIEGIALTKRLEIVVIAVNLPFQLQIYSL